MRATGIKDMVTHRIRQEKKEVKDMRKDRSCKRIYGLMAVGIVVILLMGYLPLTAVQGQEGSGFVKEEGKETDMFGGGNIVKIRFGNDAWFGVIYGTEENPNSIVIVSIAQRYLGVAEVYDRSGGKLSSNYPLRVQSIFAMRMNNMFEFNDTNDNGICDYQRHGDGLNKGDFYMHEPIYKGVSLKTAWEKSAVTRTQGENSTTWEFSLTARNLTYTDIGEVNTTGKVLDKLMFRFRLTAHLNEVNSNVPVYKIHIESAGNRENVRDSTRIENRTYSGKALSYSAKVDHDIEGWDFEEKNTNPHLLLETTSIIGYRIPIGVAKWLKEQFVSGIKGDGEVKFEDENGTTEVLDENNAPANGSMAEHPRRLKNPRIECESNWERTGRLTWLTNVTLTNNGTTTEGQMYFQVQGHRKFLVGGYSGLALYRGFALRAGFSYPAGEIIYHDPSVESDVTILDIESSTENADNVPGFEGALGIAAMLGAAGVVLFRRLR